MRKTKYISSAALGCAILFSQSASAQTGAADHMAVDLVVDGRYDSNVFNISEDRAGALNVDRGDWIVSPALRFSGIKQLGIHSINANATVGYDFHAKNSQMNRERLMVGVGGNLKLSPCEVTPQIRFSRQRSEFGSYYVDLDPLADLNNIQTEQRYGANLSCGGVLGLRPEAGLFYSKGDNSSPRRAYSDYESLEGRVGLGYRHPSIGDLSVYYSKTKTRFDNRIVNGVKEKYDVDRIGLSAKRDIGAKLSWDGAVYYVSTSTALSDGYNGLGYSIGASMRVTPQLRARAGFGRDVHTSLNNDALYTVDDTYQISADYAATNWLSLNAGYTYVERDFTYSTFFGPIPVEILNEEKLHTVDVGATYRRTDRLAFTLYGGYEKRTANRALFDYDGYFVGLRATIGLLR